MENYSPVSLAVPPRHEPLLGSFPTDPTRSYQHSSQSRREHHNVYDPSQVVTNTTGPTHDYNFSTCPSSSQQAALVVLQKFDDQIILAWLTGLRSYRPDETHWFQPGCLSSEQFEAISVLKDCSDGLVSAWLDFTRRVGWYPLQYTV